MIMMMVMMMTRVNDSDEGKDNDNDSDNDEGEDDDDNDSDEDDDDDNDYNESENGDGCYGKDDNKNEDEVVERCQRYRWITNRGVKYLQHHCSTIVVMLLLTATMIGVLILPLAIVRFGLQVCSRDFQAL